MGVANEGHSESFAWAGAVQKGYIKMWVDTVVKGSKDMIDLFKDGAFLAIQDIPSISPADNQVSLNTIQEHVMHIWDAAVVNKKWKAEDVFLYCYPMSKSVCECILS